MDLIKTEEIYITIRFTRHDGSIQLWAEHNTILTRRRRC